MGTRNPLRALVERTPWLALLLLVDGLLLLASAFLPQLPDFPFKWSLFNALNLGLEMNAAAWWSGAQLFLLGLLAWEMTVDRPDLRQPLHILAGLFMGLSLDEIGSLHERVGNYYGDIAYLPIALVAGLLLLLALRRLDQGGRERRATRLLLFAFLLMASAAPQEFLEHRVDWPAAWLGVRLAVEEGSELLGFLLGFAGLVALRNNPERTGLTAVIPDPGRLALGRRAAGALLLLELIIILGTLRFVEVGPRGNPVAWLPSMFFCALSCWAFWRWYRPQPAGVLWGVLALPILLFSLLVLYSLAGTALIWQLLGLA